MKPPLKTKSADDFQTPSHALEVLYPYLRKDWTIWECAEGNGNLSEALWRKGFNVIGSDIKTPEGIDYPGVNNLDNTSGKTYARYFGEDFRLWEPDEFDCIITNPPFSLKQQFLDRCYKIGKPFALLLPLTTFETPKRQQLFREGGVEVIFFPSRINFETPSGRGSSSWFATAWFTHGLNIGKELTFTT